MGIMPESTVFTNVSVDEHQSYAQKFGSLTSNWSNHSIQCEIDQRRVLQVVLGAFFVWSIITCGFTRDDADASPFSCR